METAKQQEWQFSLDGQPFVMYRIADEMTWGSGGIVGHEINSDQEQRMQEAFAASFVKVDEAHMAMSGCTDGRVRVDMLDGSDAPVLQKDVGCDVMSIITAAEVLGRRFYGSRDAEPIDARLDYVLDFMVQSGLRPTTHEGCGAREGFVPVKDNLISIAENPELLPKLARRIAVFSAAEIDVEPVKEVAARLKERDLSGFDPAVLREKIIKVSGPSAVKRLLDDGHGVHGHTEESIDHIYAPGYAFSTRLYRSYLERIAPDVALTERFTVNDDRVERLAGLVADTSGTDRLLSLVAMHGFGDAGHAALSKNLPTHIVRPIAA